MAKYRFLAAVTLITCLAGCAGDATEEPRAGEAPGPDGQVALEAISGAMSPIPREPEPEKDAIVREMLFRCVTRRCSSEEIKVWFIDFGEGQADGNSTLQRRQVARAESRKSMDFMSELLPCSCKDSTIMAAGSPANRC